MAALKRAKARPRQTSKDSRSSATAQPKNRPHPTPKTSRYSKVGEMCRNPRLNTQDRTKLSTKPPHISKAHGKLAGGREGVRWHFSTRTGPWGSFRQLRSHREDHHITPPGPCVHPLVLAPRSNDTATREQSTDGPPNCSSTVIAGFASIFSSTISEHQRSLFLIHCRRPAEAAESIVDIRAHEHTAAKARWRPL
jgi:hypothetical protein